MLSQLSVYLPNKPGQLADFFELLMDNQVYIYSLTVAEADDYGLILMMVEDTEKCLELMEEKEVIYSITEVIAMKLEENIGDLYKISKMLGENEVNIEYIYSTILHGENITVLRLSNNIKGMELLKDHGYSLLED